LPAPKDQAETDDAVENNHHRCEDRVACDPFAALGAGQHDRDDEARFDHRHRDREKDRAERLAELERQHLGVMDRGGHGGSEENATEDKHEQASEGTISANFAVKSAAASKGTAQAQTGMEAWCGDDIDPSGCSQSSVQEKGSACKLRAPSSRVWGRA
jgi:hypothetical protein